MDYVVAIPSLKRSNLLVNKTYKFLKKHNVEDSNIYVFVIDNEFEIYKEALPNCNIVVGRFTAKNNKNYILDYFKENTAILQLDDDIKDMYESIDEKTLTPLQDLNNFVSEGLTKLRDEKCNVMGVYPIKNAGWMMANKNAVSSSLNYCCGACILVLNYRLTQRRRLNLVEDFEFSLRNFLQFGKILRNNRICVEANQYTLAGGLQYNNNRNIDNKLKEIKQLQAEFPEYIKLVVKGNKQPDIRFLKTPHNKPVTIMNSITEEVEEVDTGGKADQQAPQGREDELYTYYVGNSEIPKYYKLCIESWFKLKYNVTILTNETLTNLPEGAKLRPVEVDENLQPAQQADIVRYEFLLDNPKKIWIDLDMFLVRRLPKLDNIISSEQPNRSGAYKTERENTPNIGVLKLSDTSILKETLKKCKALKNTSKVSCFMKIFINLLPKYDLLKYVSHWSVYCPLDWSNVKEAFNGQKLKSKYGKRVIEIDEIKRDENIIGVHLWSSFIRKYDIKGHSTNSFLAFLCK
jgi:hypothetical protein